MEVIVTAMIIGAGFGIIYTFLELGALATRKLKRNSHASRTQAARESRSRAAAQVPLEKE